jgi:uncharacterized membrane protein YoaT (DUF817 family)
MRYTGYPKRWVTVALAVLIYVNFFTHHYIVDLRWVLFVLVAIAFGRTWVYYKPYRRFHRMPLLVGFALVALFIWGAENVGTFATIWVYPDQRNTWRLVHLSKYGAWLLLMIISFILVSFAHAPLEPPCEETADSAKLLHSTICDEITKDGAEHYRLY